MKIMRGEKWVLLLFFYVHAFSNRSQRSVNETLLSCIIIGRDWSSKNEI
jgi:hypothetical protein